MTDRGHRTYALVLALFVFAFSLAAVMLNPWGSAAPDPRLASLAQREQRLRADAKLVQRVVTIRTAIYRAELQARQAQNARATARALPVAQSTAAPSVRVVNLPPLTVTRSS
jgi:hypothetical protein